MKVACFPAQEAPTRCIGVPQKQQAGLVPCADPGRGICTSTSSHSHCVFMHR